MYQAYDCVHQMKRLVIINARFMFNKPVTASTPASLAQTVVMRLANPQGRTNPWNGLKERPFASAVVRIDHVQVLDMA